MDLPVAMDPVRPKRSILAVRAGVVHAVAAEGWWDGQSMKIRSTVW